MLSVLDRKCLGTVFLHASRICLIIVSFESNIWDTYACNCHIRQTREYVVTFLNEVNRKYSTVCCVIVSVDDSPLVDA